MNNQAKIVSTCRQRVFWHGLMLLIGALYAKITLIHLDRHVHTYSQKPLTKNIPCGSIAAVRVHPDLQHIEDALVDYRVDIMDHNDITRRLEALIEQYRPRWKKLRSTELKLFLEQATDLLAPRLLPLVTHKYKNYQFIHDNNPAQSNFYPLQWSDDWRATSTLVETEDGMILSCFIGCPKNCHQISTPEEVIVTLAHEMVHRARMHPSRFFWHDAYEQQSEIDVPAQDFLYNDLGVDFQHTCWNLSQHQESEADYCAMIALRGEQFIKAQIMCGINEGIKRTAENSADTHPSSLYRIRMSLEYWIRFLIERDQLTYDTAYQQVRTDYHTLMTQRNIHPKLRKLALQLLPDRTNFSKSAQ